MIKIKNAYILPLFLISNAMICMDQGSERKRHITTGRLLIDHKTDRKEKYMSETYAQYFNQEQRQKYPLIKNTLDRTPLATPFLPIIIINDRTEEKIHTIFPATKLINCCEGSVIHFNTPDRIFHLTCIKNDKLIIKPKHLPQDDLQQNTFRAQFEGCMNHFYKKITYIDDNPSEKELIQNNILLITDKSSIDIPLPAMQIAPGIIAMPILTLPKTTYSHGPKGCASSEHLVKLATNPKTRNHGYSMFNLVMNRQQTNKLVQKLQPTDPAETGRLKCYHNYLENVKNVGNKSPMQKTVHSSKDSSIDVVNTTPMNAEETPDQAILDTILEDCLIEFAAQEAAVLDHIAEDCLTDFAIPEVKVVTEKHSAGQSAEVILLAMSALSYRK